MGRLHRHLRGGESQRERPERLRTARCLVSGVDWTTSVPKPVRGSIAVYGAYALLRSAAALLPHLEGAARRPVRLPTDISPLVQHAYAEESRAPADWSQDLEEARARYDELRADQAERAATFRLGAVARPGRPLFGWVTAGVGDADDTSRGKAQVRDSRETLEVVVVQRKSDGSLATVPTPRVRGWSRVRRPHREDDAVLPARAGMVPPTSLEVKAPIPLPPVG
ncbi:hypothetical protein [Streptomyces sp. NPDC002913]